MVISSWVLVALVLLTSPLMASSASPPPIPGFSEQVCTTPSRHRRLSSCPPVPSFPSPLSSPLTAHPGGASRWKTPGPLSVCEPAPVRPDQLHRHESSSSSSPVTRPLNLSSFTLLGLHFGIFPRPLGQIVTHANVTELRLSISKNSWNLESWGLPPRSVVSGAELSAWFEDPSRFVSKSLVFLACASQSLPFSFPAAPTRTGRS